jgi:hypothetical protein
VYSSQKIEYDLWSVTGYIETEQEQGKPINTAILISVQPPLQHVDPDGRFTIKDIRVRKGEKIQLPMLVIQKEGYEVEVVRFEDKDSPNIIYSKMQKNRIHIKIKDKIKLRRMGERFEYSAENVIDAMPIEEE